MQLAISTSSPYAEKVRPYFNLDASPPGVCIVGSDIYSWPKNDVYVAGEGDTRVRLPTGTDEVEVDHQTCRPIEEAAAGVPDELRDETITRRRALPLTNHVPPFGSPGRRDHLGRRPATGFHGIFERSKQTKASACKTVRVSDYSGSTCVW